MFGKNDAVVIESKLGSGGIGAAYKAWHTGLNKYVVVKELKHSAANDASVRRNEVEALKNVKNAHLPQVIDYFTDNDCSYTVMEFVEGESFDKLLAPGRGFSPSQVVKWYGQLASALEAIHSQGVCHRDIKPSNVMLAPGGDVCLIDFNAALVRGAGARLISRSPGYASPEQDELFRRCAAGDFRCDCGPCGGDTATVLLEAESITEWLPAQAGSDAPLPSAHAPLPSTHAPLPSMYSSLPYSPLPYPPQNYIDWKLSDIYCLGATMCHLLTGKRPRERAFGMAPVLENARCDSGLAGVIERSMRIDPAERYDSATSLSRAIRRLN